jgi:hypothetical protein
MCIEILMCNGVMNIENNGNNSNKSNINKSVIMKIMCSNINNNGNGNM